ncbi:hypothetical protein SERLA73DRAFT_183600 [Serpula lacrymans var. lacrymans S7.3]|uniref:Gelsolin-like domain-containing protein n=2 Tax=Serpula lacrymans var. lacrymans TaxID=341189 RepID=F8Q071_SERL3|nr:uncharacterized protein SERLADRAFT_356747 [Serpula lacrymans var. lacrymans S7.9]EGN98543.1 hypothetical protein SERLA73DRAFT_183600 [Serpula lacrymans var. lacrymans S7.3]EGO24112.1 hypothetical protein SERLADRAFT_356747 [Serpula lacrymans var. lacrymans S7.9]
MALLTRGTTYDIKDSNIALLGSDLEKHVREHAGDKENAWQGVGHTQGLKIWRIEHFTVVDWPKERTGSFYDGDSYIVLHTYKADPESETLSYDLHFWLGESTSQDEAGTAAYKTVELDDHLGGVPVQYREVQGYESPRFLSYFPHFVCLHGGVSTGFHHVSAPPEVTKLYRISISHATARSHLLVREVPVGSAHLIQGSVYVLDKGEELWQFNSKTGTGQEKFRAAEYVQNLSDQREGRCEVTVFDEGESGAGAFLSELGAESVLPPASDTASELAPSLYRLVESDGAVGFEDVALSTSSLRSDGVYFLDDDASNTHAAIYAWVGKETASRQKQLATQYAQTYLYEKQAREGERVKVAVSIVKLNEGREPEAFLKLLQA